MDVQFIAGVATVVGSMYGMLKFMLKDTHKRVDLLEQDQKEYKAEQQEFRKEIKLEHQEFRKEVREIHNRLDGLYRVILSRSISNDTTH